MQQGVVKRQPKQKNKSEMLTDATESRFCTTQIRKGPLRNNFQAYLVLFTLASCINYQYYQVDVKTLLFIISNFGCERSWHYRYLVYHLFANKTGILVPQQVCLLFDNSQEGMDKKVETQTNTINGT